MDIDEDWETGEGAVSNESHALSPQKKTAMQEGSHLQEKPWRVGLQRYLRELMASLSPQGDAQRGRV